MPRERNPSRLSSRAPNIISPQKSPMKLPLNDDQKEKSIRLQSRKALHELQLSQIKAAASPARKKRSIGPTSTPTRGDNKENDGDQDLAIVGGAAVQPVKRVPILANFEEWMKMATDNKINATNSWNFALIDYFHDMSLLKEGDGVNFQKASCTLDGCVKIYTSRVDSVATETGKLLSGLADSGDKKRKGGGEGEDEDGEEGGGDDDEEGEDGVKKRSKKRVQRSSEATLVSSFAQLQLKKMELEFSVDPLFKKATADFDEGGAKGLLLNHLTIDSDGRIVFDSSDDTLKSGEAEHNETSDTEDKAGALAEDALKLAIDRDDINEVAHPDIDLESLRSRFFPNLAILDEHDVCPSLKTFELGGSADPMDIPFLKAPDDWKKDADQGLPEPALDMGGSGFDDDDDVNLGGFDVPADIGFGEGGEAWAKEAAIGSRPRVFSNEEDADGADSQGLVETGAYDPNGQGYDIVLKNPNEFDQENLLKYFDETLKKNWAGPEHWRIQKIKDHSKPAAPTTKRKEKEPFQIDFRSPLSQSQIDMLTIPAANNSSISLPKSQWKSKTRNLLPDDKHFNSKQLLSLFLKPNARIGSRRWALPAERKKLAAEGDEMDEAFWAKQQENAASDAMPAAAAGDYDANFFQDDNGFGIGTGLPDDDDDEFADARETFSPGIDDDGQGGQAAQPGAGTGGFGDQLVTQNRRMRPEYVQYARVAKKVDVRKLKEELWKGLAFEEPIVSASAPAAEDAMEIDDPAKEEQAEPKAAESEIEVKKEHEAEQPPLKFTSVMNDLQSAYPKQAMADISTSYCFICLLHLANEKGLVLENGDTFEEISIRKDHTALITEVDA